MPIPVVRRASGLPALAAVAVLAITGCEAAPGKPAPEPSSPVLASESPSASPPPATRPLTAAELVAAALPAEETPDAYGHPVSVRKSRAGGPKSEPSDPACAQLLAAAHARHVSRPTPVVAEQSFNWRNDLGSSHSTLASYGATGAQDAFRLITEGLSTCRYYESPAPAPAPAPAPTMTYKGTVTVGPAPRLGNEAVQFEVTAPTELGLHVTQYTVIRTGSVVATFTRQSTAGLDERAFQPALIAQQISLLQDAQLRPAPL
ncbi:hypothetical protein ACGFYU_30560 [Streptomyces sp. NPDC048337]|uniref:hypothetical protein n=1 Tax=Streptomyces sp. NPDC048337 TaxID=3365535 RepID=UPI00371F2EA1